MLALLLHLLTATNSGPSYFEKLSRRVEAAQTLSGTITATLKTQHTHWTSTFHFAYKRPNLLRTEVWEHGRLTELKVSDGRTTWTEDGAMAAVYTNPSPPDEFPKNALLTELGSPGASLGPLFKASKRGVRAGVDISSVITKRNFSYRVEMRRGFPVPRREVISKLGLTAVYQCDAIRFNESISTSAFTLKPAAPVNPTDVTALLLPIGTQAPDFSATMTDGSSFHMRSFLKGAKATVVEFWHICEPCESELLVLLSLKRQFASQGLRLVSVFNGINEGTCHRAMLAMRASGPVVLGCSAVPNIEIAYRDCATPTAYILDSQGVVRFRYAGDCSGQINKDLQTLGIGPIPMPR